MECAPKALIDLLNLPCKAFSRVVPDTSWCCLGRTPLTHLRFDCSLSHCRLLLGESGRFGACASAAVPLHHGLSGVKGVTTASKLNNLRITWCAIPRLPSIDIAVTALWVVVERRGCPLQLVSRVRPRWPSFTATNWGRPLWSVDVLLAWGGRQAWVAISSQLRNHIVIVDSDSWLLCIHCAVEFGL